MITRTTPQRAVNPFALPAREAPADVHVAPFPPRHFRLDEPPPVEVVGAIQSAKLAAGAIAASQIDVGAIDFAPVLLDRAATDALIARKTRALEKSLFGVESDHAAFPRRTRAAQSDAYREYLLGRDRGELVRSPQLIAYHRLIERAPEQLVAALDPSTGRVTISERIDRPALPTEVVSGASSGIAMQGLTEVQERYLRSALDAILPAAMLSILSRSKTRLAFTAELGEVSPTARARFGEGCAIAELACPELGRFWPFLGEAMIPLVPETTASTEALLTIVVHELAHALDWALGEPGMRWSESAEWKALFAATETFPTERSAQNEAEFFAECAAIHLLGRHLEVQPLRDQIATRSDLPRTVRERLDALFARELDGDRRMPEATPRIEIERAIARAEAAAPSFAAAFYVAAWTHILAVVTGSAEARTNALSAVADALARERAEGGDGAYSEALQREIESR